MTIIIFKLHLVCVVGGGGTWLGVEDAVDGRSVGEGQRHVLSDEGELEVKESFSQHVDVDVGVGVCVCVRLGGWIGIGIGGELGETRWSREGFRPRIGGRA